MVDIPANTTTTAWFDGAPGGWGSFSGSLETPGDKDWIKVYLDQTKTYQFWLHFQEAGADPTTGDSFLRIYDANGNFVVGNDDRSQSSLNSFIEFQPSSAGTYYIEVAASGDNKAGQYSVAYKFKNDGETFVDLSNLPDTYSGQAGEVIAGGKSNDSITVADGAGTLLGEQGDDTLIGRDGIQQDYLFGGLGDDHLHGLSGTDYLFGDAGNDTIYGGSGSDGILGGPGADELYGGAGNDLFYLQGSNGIGDVINGGADDDTVLNWGNSPLTLSTFNAAASSIETFDGDGYGLFGTSAANTFNFAALVKKLELPFIDGKGGNDKITGSDFADVLRGGAGKDTLTGGAGRDFFDFNKISESKVGAKRDVITDFKRGQDHIDLKDIDAKKGVGGNNKFKFIGKDDFGETKGELRYEDKGSTVIVQGDVNGDGKADFEIMVKAGALSAGDFVL
ncbi:MAG: calcium-binding protein [Methyloceanibacter sp.]|uniref:calcium-binding protein n=1 Tax=Methyloceanibacter sp. TaxID=1965321 RepID=UPI003D6CFA72